jgi:hypothetical protein
MNVLAHKIAGGPSNKLLKQNEGFIQNGFCFFDYISVAYGNDDILK